MVYGSGPGSKLLSSHSFHCEFYKQKFFECQITLSFCDWTPETRI